MKTQVASSTTMTPSLSVKRVELGAIEVSAAHSLHCYAKLSSTHPCHTGLRYKDERQLTEVVNQSEATSSPSPTLVEAFWVWFRIGVLSFGGPAAQIALVHREVVEARGWLKEQQYLNALSFCMLLPGGPRPCSL